MRYRTRDVLVMLTLAAIAQQAAVRPAAAQRIVPVPCPALLGPRPIVVDGIVFSGVTFIMVRTTASNGGYYTTSPSEPVSDDGLWVWIDAAVSLLCYDIYYPTAPIQVIQHAYEVVETYGPLIPISSGGGGGSCDYQIIPDPSAPPCPDGGGGGGGGGGTGGDGGSGSGTLCSSLQLAPGCYDVYVDNIYQGTVCC